MTTTYNAAAAYLRDKIDNNWYRNSDIDYGVTGHVNTISTYGDKDQHLLITYTENHDGGHPMYDIVSECSISWYADYTPEQLYYIWMTDAS